MACDPVQNCKSRRCAQAGVCNCLLVYSDGSQVPGSGTGDDPYVIERPPIKAIRDASGQLLTPDSNRTVQLPTYIQKIVSAETGVEYRPDNSGRVVLPVQAIATLSFKDVDGNILTVDTDDVITIDMDDGTNQTGFPQVNPIEKRITFPNLKVYEYQVSDVPVNLPSSNGNVTFNTNVLDFVGPNPPSSYQNGIFHPFSVALQIYHAANPYETANNDYFTFDIIIDYNRNPTPFRWPIASDISFIGDKAQAYNSYFFSTQLPTQDTDDLTLLLVSKEVQMDGYRKQNLRIDAQVMGQWV